MKDDTDIDASHIGSTSHRLRTGLPCENCGELIEQRYCSACGQLAADFHRPLFGLLSSSLADSLALDGRLVRTLRDMLLRPGRMTRKYLNGQRQRYVPPFRLYIFTSLIFFFVLFGLQGVADNKKAPKPPAEEAQTEMVLGTEDAVGVDLEEAIDEEGRLDSDALTDLFINGESADQMSEAERQQIEHFSNRLSAAYNNPEDFMRLMKTYAPRASILMVPLLAMMLTLLYINKRGPMLFEHFITALHFQSFVYVAFTIIVLVGTVVAALGTLGGLLIIPYLFYYMYRTQRRVYAGGRWLTVARTSVLTVLMLTCFSILIFGIAATALLTL